MTTTPGMDALVEAMRLEQARIYGTTQRELRDAAFAEEIAKRREIAASINGREDARVIDLHSRRRAAS